MFDPWVGAPERGRVRWRLWTWRGVGLALFCVASISCCPVPAGLGEMPGAAGTFSVTASGTSSTSASASASPTAFAARVAADLDGSWFAETTTGARYRIAGAAPGALGAWVYLEGWIEPDGTLVVAKASAVDAR